MKKLFLPALILAFLVGCSSQPSTDDVNRLVTMTGGQSIGNTTSYYWYTEQLDAPYSATDYVNSGDYGWYKTDYRWRGSVIREIMREGEKLSSKQELLPYKLHLRFNKKGEAVYQQYRLDGKVLPVPSEQIKQVQDGGKTIRTTVKEQSSKGQKLIQGYWDGEEFQTCQGNTYKNIEFNQILPSFVVNRLASLDSYAAFLGTTSPAKLTVLDLYTLDEDSVDCLTRPVLISD